MNSNRVVTYSLSHCNYCHEDFYEFRDYELSHCPNCEAEFGNKGDCYTVEDSDAMIEIEHKTGKIRLLESEDK